MKRTILLLVICLGTTVAAQAQSTVLVHGIVAGLSLGRRAAQGEFADKTVKASTYRGQSFTIKRTPTDQLTGKASDLIAFLEAQLEKCHLALLADSIGTVCSTDQQTTIQAIQSLIANAP